MNKLFMVLLAGMVAVSGCGQNGIPGTNGNPGQNGVDGQDGESASVLVQFVGPRLTTHQYEALSLSAVIVPESISYDAESPNSNQQGWLTLLVGSRIFCYQRINGNLGNNYRLVNRNSNGTRCDANGNVSSQAQGGVYLLAEGEILEFVAQSPQLINAGELSTEFVVLR